jgi:hypothetical protein
MSFQWPGTLLLLGFLLVVFPVMAQDSREPIVIIDDHREPDLASIYRLEDGDLTLISDSLYVLDAALSPDGRLLATNVVAPVYLEREEGCSGSIPDDLWLLNLETGDPVLLREQPENATYFCGDDNNISRSQLDWSPDGTQFVWTEYNFGDDTLSLGIYDVATAEVELIPFDFPEQHGLGPLPLTPYWLASGIAFYSVVYDSMVSVRLYRPDGTLIVETPLGSDLVDNYGFPNKTRFITYRGRDYVAHNEVCSYWQFYDLLTQQRIGFGETFIYPEVVSAAHPDTSLRVRVVDSSTADAKNVYQVEMVDSSGTVLHESTDFTFSGDYPSIPYVVIFSPDGQTLGFEGYDQETYSYENQVTFIGADQRPPFIPDETVVGFQLLWGQAKSIVPDDFEFIDMPDPVVCG